MKHIVNTAIVAIALVQVSNAQINDSTQREVKLEGAINFRDIGGYATTNGKHVKWGKLYRSAAINKLTDADLSILEARKIAYDDDFRGDYEVSLAPDRVPSGATRISLPAGSEDAGKPSQLKQFLMAKDKDSGMVAFYGNTTILRDRYKPIFDQMFTVSPDSAILFHCSAGKDRTGIGAALILYVLGVPQDKIVEDYLASNYYRKATIEKDAAQMSQMFGLSPEQAKSMAGVRIDYLQATYNAINNKYGSLDVFLKKELGLDKKKIEILRAKYLE